MNRQKRFEMMFFPSNSGMIKVHIYGFHQYGASGRVYAVLNDTGVCIKGFNRYKTMIKALSKLNEILLKMTDES